MSDNKYKLNEEFWEITFQIPKDVKNVNVIHVADRIKTNFKRAVNIRVIPCKIVKEPRRLAVSKDNYSHTVWNIKQESQIIDD